MLALGELQVDGIFRINDKRKKNIYFMSVFLLLESDLSHDIVVPKDKEGRIRFLYQSQTFQYLLDLKILENINSRARILLYCIF